MLKGKFSYTPPAALAGSLRDYRRPHGADLQARVEGFYKWENLRQQHGLWPFSRSMDESPSAVTAARDDAGARFRGVNFASGDYLALGSHPAIKAAAREAIETYGVHTAGAAAQFGATAQSVLLERRIADFLEAPEAILFPSGWAAGYGAIKALVRSSDHIVMDALAHACLQEGAVAATRNIYLYQHNQVEACRRWLEKIRARDVENGVMVVTESLFSSDSEIADIAAMQALCDEFNASLLVNAAHDLGATGPGGRGVIGEQKLLGQVDLVMGSFSKAFASNGGFVACRSREVKEYLRFFASPCAHSSALSPIQAATIMKAFEIVEGPEGEALRQRLAGNVQSLRGQLTGAGLEIHGAPSPMVCVKMGEEGAARLVMRRLPEAGLIANLVEFPAAPKDQARLRLQVMAGHTSDNLRDATAGLADAWRAGREEFEWLNSEREKLRARA
jgi:glycine C-acetyltransferase